MKLRNSLAILCSLGFCFSFALTGCNTNSNQKPNPSSPEVQTEYTITFDSKGGTQVPSIVVKDGEKVTKPTNPTKDNFEFVEWCEDNDCLISFNFDTEIHSDLTLYAKWQSSGGGGDEQNVPHGPEGSTLVNWYIVGHGPSFSSSWVIEGGYQLYSNPASTTDKGCILNISFAVDELFKVTDGETWYGYDKVDQWDDSSNKGRSNFEGADDGYNGLNIKCKIAGTYNIYVNQYGNFWIESA